MKHHVVHLLLLLLVCAIVFGFQVGSYDFWGRHGEARRAEVSREMVASGNWLVPHLNGEPFVTKPPLYYWAAAAMFKLTGRFDEFSARIPSVIAGTLGVLVTYFWANAMFSARVGCFAGIILATSFLYSGMARTADVDMMLTLFTTTALYFFTLGYLRRQTAANLSGKWNLSTVMYFLSALCIALGTM
ncbi:MAG: glycosyltransferase family 39 protein, partial [Candidatus Vecturithrix sp.]|nr:glycosyltransferase family 39 protein [Candidatus Vecturithrix sp.]